MIEKTFPLVEKLIVDALTNAGQLLEQLNQEADALKTIQQTESIDRIAANKKLLVSKLEQFNVDLGRILASENLPGNQQGIDEYFIRAAAANLCTEPSASHWQSIRTLCAASKVLNEQNGASIDLLNRHTKRSLQILKGKPQHTSTYGPDGITQSDSYARTLVMA